jgi:hypothetical protein
MTLKTVGKSFLVFVVISLLAAGLLSIVAYQEWGLPPQGIEEISSAQVCSTCAFTKCCI